MDQDFMGRMPRYKCHKVVSALKIALIAHDAHPGVLISFQTNAFAPIRQSAPPSCPDKSRSRRSPQRQLARLGTEDTLDGDNWRTGPQPRARDEANTLQS